MASLIIDGKPVGVARVVYQSTTAKPEPAAFRATPTNDKFPGHSSAEQLAHPAASTRTQCSATCRHVTRSAEEYIDRCPYFFGSMSSSHANKLVASQSAGTFLLRRSSDERYPYALTVKTSRGPKSIRVTRTPGGSVQLDCDASQRTAVRCFDDVFQLIHYHVRYSSLASATAAAAAVDGPRKAEVYMFTDRNGTPDLRLVLRRSLDVALRRSPPALSAVCLERLNCNFQQRERSNNRSASVGSASVATDTAAGCVECYVDSLLAQAASVTCYHDDKLRSLLMNYPFGY